MKNNQTKISGKNDELLTLIWQDQSDPVLTLITKP